LIVSGWVTSPFELSRIDSGEAKLIVTLEKSLLSFLFFLNPIVFERYVKGSCEP
jgi:hypothetical protein